MPFLNLEQELKRAGAARPFANGFEGESWMANWCENCRFSKDDTCTLIDVALLGKTPYMWERYQQASLGWAYLCHAYRPSLVTDQDSAPLVIPPPP